MGSERTFPVGAMRKGLTLFTGLVLTDASGNVLNANPATAKDQYGNDLVLPSGVSAISHVQAGLYRITFGQPWFGLSGAAFTPYTPIDAVRATVRGTVDLTTLTLSTLNTQTLQTDADVGANYTTTFTTPTSIQNIADQINAGNGSTSVFASIDTSITGKKYLRVVSTTQGNTSTLAINTASTAKVTLGMATGTTTAQGLGSLTVAGYNTRGSDIDYQPAQTIDVLHAIAGVGASLVSGGFKYQLWMANLP